jgi:hypothetical protein
MAAISRNLFVSMGGANDEKVNERQALCGDKDNAQGQGEIERAKLVVAVARERAVERATSGG